MENLSLRDDRLYRNDTARSRTRHPEYHPPRLPTPEPSRSSLEAHEGGYPSETMQKDSVRDVALRPPSDGQLFQVDGFRASQNETHRQTAPQSPPYEVLDEQRPSLPPLKTVRLL